VAEEAAEQAMTARERALGRRGTWRSVLPRMAGRLPTPRCTSHEPSATRGSSLKRALRKASLWCVQKRSSSRAFGLSSSPAHTPK
jgi:hypothetical protein